MEYVEITEGDGEFRWTHVDGNGTHVGHATQGFDSYSGALRDAARACGGNLRSTEDYPDRYWLL